LSTRGASELTTLKELMRSYVNLVEESTRVMLRIKALFRARAIKTPGPAAHITAGHTRGCTSWSFPVRDGDRMLNVVSVCDLGVLPTSRYPEQAADRERSLRVLRSLPAGILGDQPCKSVGEIPQVRRQRHREEPGGCIHRPRAPRAGAVALVGMLAVSCMCLALAA
jgi:hypothetical protein